MDITISDSVLPLPCIVCGKKLEPAFKNSNDNQPLGGLGFSAGGAYGSNFDPMDSRLSLILSVCDECLASKGASGHVVMQTQERPVSPSPTFVPYIP